MQSLYEIETIVKRSAKAQGLSWGVSEEVGKTIRYLEQSNLAGLESFKRVIDIGLDNLTKLLEIDQKNGIHCTTGSLGHGLPIATGMAFSQKIQQQVSY